MHYRRDIDGLRAVAVVPVILFHAGLPGFGGGYLGVDVFFVISGYLITAILLDARARGGISIRDFYERRARRILPALFLVMAFCTIVGWFWLYPRLYASFFESLGLTALFMSNLHFMTETGYFADQADVRPLLHTWSLAVEEQFYLIYPLIVAAVLRWWPGRLMAVVAALALASFGFAIWARDAYPDQTFFFPVSRAWELLAGALAALQTARQPRTGWASIGLGLILVSLVGGGTEQPFPTPWAFVVVAGTVLVLRYGQAGAGLGGRFLALRGVVGIGLVSYGAYLWHQPLMAFARLRLLEPPPTALMLALAVLSVALGALTWRFVENPVRRRTFSPLASRQRLFLWAALTTVLFFVVGLTGFVKDGFPARVSPQVQAASAARIDNPWRPRCERGRLPATPVHPIPDCGSLQADRNVILMGDSHAAAMAGAMMPALKDAGFGAYVTTMGGCAVIPGLHALPQRSVDDCRDFTDAGWQFAGSVPDATVVLAMRWQMYLDERRFDTAMGIATPQSWVVRAGLRDAADDPARAGRLLDQMVAQIAALAARQRVVLVYPVPEPANNVTDRAARMGMFASYPDALTTSLADETARTATLTAAFNAIDSPNLIRIRPEALFCGIADNNRCDQLRGDLILYADDNHVTRAGADRIAAAILSALQ